MTQSDEPKFCKNCGVLIELMNFALGPKWVHNPSRRFSGWYEFCNLKVAEPPEEEPVMAQRAYAPHCDPSILHSPGSCEACDHYPDWQEHRKVAMIAFSDEKDLEGKAPCPSTYFRDPEVRDRWGGNIAVPRGPHATN